MNSRNSLASLRLLSAGIPTPRDYRAGLSRTDETPPDNILMFLRRSPAELATPANKSFFHERWVLIAPLRGSALLGLDAGAIRLQPGEAIVVPPLCLHSYRAPSPKIEWLFITFDWPRHGAADLSSGHHRLGKLSADAIRKLKAVIDGWLYAPDDGLSVAADLLSFVRCIYPANTMAGGPESDVGRNGWLDKVLTTAEQTPAPSLKAIAREIGMSESHLRTRFRRECGMSLGRYLRESRLRKAALSIRESGASVREAAELAGYSDAFNFSRAFHRALGMPPSKIRRRPMSK